MIIPGKVGRLKPPEHKRMRRARLGASLIPPAPASWACPAGVISQLFANDAYGDCTEANLGNLVAQLVATFCGGRTVSFTTPQIVARYMRMTGGVDSGLCEVDVLADSEESGFEGEELGAVLAIDPTNINAARSLCALFGGLYIGAELPARGQLQLSAGEAWDLPSLLDDSDAPGSWGGHAMYVAGFAPGAWSLGTWGQIQSCTDAWWSKYVDECYVVVLREQLLRATVPDLARLVGILGAAASEDATP